MDSGRIALLGLAAVALATGVSYAIARPAPPARVDRPGVVWMLGRWVYWTSRPVVRAAIAAGVTADGMTTIGVALTLAAAVAAAFGAWAWAVVFLVLGSWCDLMDGELARSTSTQTPAGAFLDSTLDRISEILLFAGLAWGSPGRTAAWAVAAMAGSLMVSYARARGEGLGVDCPTFGMERPHRLVVVIFSLLAAAFMPPALAVALVEATCALLALSAAATAARRMWVIHGLLLRKHAAASEDGAPRAAERPHVQAR